MIAHGSELLLQFLITTLLSSVIYIQSAFQMLPDNWVKWALCLGGALLAEFILFWNGIISVYCTSVQLGIKHRFIGIICGFIPIVNLFCLGVIIKITMQEVNFEIDKAELDRKRINEKICKTKYPVLFVHGVFFVTAHISIIGAECRQSLLQTAQKFTTVITNQLPLLMKAQSSLPSE